jgi:hypothetical protein
MDLVEFLRERLAEDEQIAQTPSGGGYEPDIWEIQPSRSGRWSNIVSKSKLIGEPVEAAMEEDDQPVAIVQSGRWEDRHIARHDPARVLAEVAAKRRIVHAHDRIHGCTGLTGSGDWSAVDGEPWEFWEDHQTGDTGGICYTLRLLALPYAEHPDYNPEWRP